MAEKTKKKKEPISSFSILLILLVVLAVISWIAAAATGRYCYGCISVKHFDISDLWLHWRSYRYC